MRRTLLAACLAAWACDDGGGGESSPIVVDGAIDSGGASDMADRVADMARADMADPLADMSLIVDMAQLVDMAVPNAPIGVDHGEMAPNFELRDADDMQVALADYRGQHVLVAGASAW